MTTKKRLSPLRVSMYFGKNNRQVYERLENVSKITGLSLSKVSSMALKFGVRELEERLIEPSQLIPSDKAKKIK